MIARLRSVAAGCGIGLNSAPGGNRNGRSSQSNQLLSTEGVSVYNRLSQWTKAGLPGEFADSNQLRLGSKSLRFEIRTGLLVTRNLKFTA